MVSNKNGIKRQLLISSCIYIGQILLGFSLSWTGPIIPKLRDLEQSPLPYMLTETEISLIASLFLIGALPGPYIMGWLSNYKGRKPCLIAGAVLSIIGYAILAMTKDISTLYFSRVVVGLGSGIYGPLNVVYIGEIASTSIRGVLLTVVGMFTTVGGLLLFTTGPFLSYRVSTSVGLGVSIVFLLSSLTLPDTPIYYILKDDGVAVQKLLNKLGRLEDKENLYEAAKEYKSTNNKMDWVELFTLRTNKRGLFIVVIINILQNFSGVMAVIFFSASIFKIAGSSISASTSMIIIGCFQLLGSLLAPFFIEKSGRKFLLLISTALCSASMLFLGFYFYLEHIGNSVINNLKWLPMVLLVLFFIGYDSGIGIIPHVLIGEMFTSNVRSKGSAVASTCSWTAGFLVTTVFGATVENLGGHVAFWFFSFTCACAFVFTIFCIPETKAKNLLEIQKLLKKWAPIFISGHAETTVSLPPTDNTYQDAKTQLTCSH